MLVTALSPVIGYDKASKLAHYALDNDLTLKQAATKLGFVSEEELTVWSIRENGPSIRRDPELKIERNDAWPKSAESNFSGIRAVITARQ
jgi:hypothetical protein